MSDNSKSLFSFQKMNKYFLLPFFVPVICFSSKFFSETMKTDNDKIKIQDVSTDNTHTFVFLYQIIQSICLILGGLIYFIQNCILKIEMNKQKYEEKLLKSVNAINTLNTDNIYDINKNDDEEEENNSNFEHANPKTSENIEVRKKDNSDKTKKLIIIIFIPLLFILYNLSIAYGVKHPQLEKRIYFLFFFTLINIFLFKKQIYRHQKFSLLITFIGIIPIFIAFWVYLNYDEYNYIYDLILLIGSFGYSLYLVSIKFLTHNKSVSVFLLLLVQGGLSFVYTLIIYIVMSLIIKGDITYITNIFQCDETNYICVQHLYFNIIMFILFNTPLQTLIFFVVYIFSPEVFAISDIFSPLFSFISICVQIRETKVMKIILTVLGYLIIAVAAFIYNEILICNFWKLNENTSQAIHLKAQNEFDKSEMDNIIILNDKDETKKNNRISYLQNHEMEERSFSESF